MFEKKPLNDKQVLVLVRLIYAMKRFLVFLAILGQLWSIIPWNLFYKIEASEITTESITQNNENDETKYPTTSDISFNPSSIQIDQEIIDERTATTKTFRKIDGTYETALYKDVIHYYDKGSWKDIDNQLIDIKDDYTTKDNRFLLNFPKSIDENNKIKMTLDDYGIEWQIKGINSSSISIDNQKNTSNHLKELIHTKQSVRYYNINPHTDLEYIVTGSEIKENIIVNEYHPSFELTFIYELKNLSLLKNDKGKQVFINQENMEIFEFTKVIMYDAELNISSDIKFDIIDLGKNKYEVKIKPNDTWLKNATYPITIDPTIKSSEQSVNIYDTFVSKDQNNQDFSSLPFLKISSLNNTNESRGLISFYIPNSVQNKEIVLSTLTLNDLDNPFIPKTQDRIIGIYENTEYFIPDEVNWDTYPDHTQAMTDYHIIGEESNYIFDITKTVKDWQLLGTTQVPGFTIKDKNNYGADNYVGSVESPVSTLKPTIEITYIDPSGIKDYWTYSEQSVGTAGTGYISDYAGKLTFIRNVLQFTTDKQSFGLSLIYNIDNKNINIGYGLGWKTNYSMTYQEISENLEYAITDGTGNTVHYFLTECDSRFPQNSYETYTCFLAEDGSSNIFYKLSTSYGTTFYMITRSQIKYTFNNTKHLVNITNTKTNIDIAINRDASDQRKITSIIDDSGNKIDLTYNANGDLYYAYLNIKQSDNSFHTLEKVKHVYTYRSACLDYALYYSVKYSDYDTNEIFTVSPKNYYMTDSASRLTSVYETSGEKITYTYNLYDTADRIYTIKKYLNNKLYTQHDYSYEYKKTMIVDENLDYIIYKFDNYGHTVNILDNKGNAQSFDYINIFSISEENPSILLLDGMPNYHLNHQLISQSDPYKTFDNKIQNYSFEISNNFSDYWVIDQLSSPYYLETCFDDSISLYGDYSAKIYVPDNNHYGSYKQTVTLDYGNYILSGYVKNDSITDQVNISINGDVLENTSFNVNNDGEWHYIEVLIDVDYDNTDVIVGLNSFSIGSVYFDNIQLIEGFRNTSKNIVDNSSFEILDEYDQLHGWTFSDTNEVNRSEISSYSYSLEEKLLGEYGIRINGYAKENRYAWSSFSHYLSNESIKGTLTVGGWAYAESTPMSIQSTDNYAEIFRIRVDVLSTEESYGSTNYDDAVISINYIDFNPSIDGWQFRLKEIPFEVGNIIYVTLEYQGEGFVIFDQLQMYYESINSNYYYDAFGRITSKHTSTDTTLITYDNDNDDRPTKIESEFVTLELEIDGAASLVESITYNNIRHEKSYNSNGQITGTLTGDVSNFFTTSTTYLSSGFSQYIETTENEFNQTTTYYTDTMTGLLEAIRNAQNEDLLFVYDDEGYIVKAVHVDNHSTYNQNSENYALVEYTYTAHNLIDKIILERDENGVPSFYYQLNYDDHYRISSVMVNSMFIMSYTYVVNGDFSTNKVSTQTYGNGDVINFSYNDNDQISSVDFNNAKKFSYEYDQSGLIAVYREYDYFEEVKHEEYYTYDSSGNLIQMVDSNNNKIEYMYDVAGNLIQLDFTFEDVNQQVDYHHNKCLLADIVYGTCIESSTLYDYTDFFTQDGNRVSKYYMYEETALKRLDQVLLFHNGTSLITQTHQYSGSTLRVNDITYSIKNDSTTYKYAYSYDELGNITDEYYYEGAWLKTYKHYEYNELNQLVVVDSRDYSIPSSSTLTETNNTKFYYYDSRGNITEIKTFLYGQNDYSNPVLPSFYEESTGFMELTMFYNGPSTYQDIYEIELGDIVSLNFMYYDLTNDTFVTGLTTTCTYSNVNVNVDGYYERMYVATDGFFYQLTFRIVIKVGNPLGDPTIPQSHLRYHYQEGWKDQLSTYGNVLYINGVEQSEIILQTFTYDSQGNPTTISNFQYDGTTYDYAQLSYDGRELKSISVFNQSSVVPVVMITYTYNDQGYRTQKKIDWMTQGSQIIDYYLTGHQVLYETDGTYGMIYTYDYDGTLISFTYDNNTQDSIDGITYYYLRNQQGDIIKIIDEDGSILVTYTYDAWGKMIGTVDLSMNDLASINPYRYRGYRYDEEIEWYYLNSRYYDGNLGRFINADGLLGEVGNPLGHNMYAYCVNNPVMYVDPSGESFILFALIAVIVLFTPIGGAAAQIVTSSISYVGLAAWAVGDLAFNGGNGAWSDMNSIGWNPFNTDESTVYNSNHFSFYKGAPVFLKNSGRSGSFYAISLNKNMPYDVLRHERGHNTQAMMMGIGTYGFTVGIPSWQKWGPWASSGNYYSAPWETLADILGGVQSRSHTRQEISQAWGYYAVSSIFFLDAYLFLL